MPKKSQKEKVRDEISRRGLTSVLNGTKWRELTKAIKSELPFRPPYQMKSILSSTLHPSSFEKDVWYHGDYSREGIEPFYLVEWIRIRPRYLLPQGRLIPSKIIEIEEEVIALLNRLDIPYKYERESIWIFGYTSDTGQIRKKMIVQNRKIAKK